MNAVAIGAEYVVALKQALDGLSLATVSRIAAALEDARAGGRTVFVVGNGQSASTASRIADDLRRAATAQRARRWRAVAVAGADSIRPGDVIVAISRSGRSSAVLDAVSSARTRGGVTIGLTGSDGGLLKDLVDICLTVPVTNTSQIENVHLAVGQILTTMLMRGRGPDRVQPERAPRSSPPRLSGLINGAADRWGP